MYLRSAVQIAAIPAQYAVVVTIDASVPHGLSCYQAPSVAAQYASQLYAMLRELDTQGYEAIYVQQPPQRSEWEAVNDRLGRAAAAFE